MVMTTPLHLRKIMGLIAEAEVKRQDIAAFLGYSETMFSLYLHGKRTTPDGFEEQVLTALSVLERAEQAAQEARARVLAEAAEEEK